MSETALSREKEVGQVPYWSHRVEDADTYFKHASFIGKRFIDDTLHENHCGKYNEVSREIASCSGCFQSTKNSFIKQQKNPSPKKTNKNTIK